MKWLSNASVLVVLAVLAAGCAASDPGQPFGYLPLQKPTGQIDAPAHRDVQRSFSRGGWYFLNSNFRPAADVGATSAKPGRMPASRY